MNNLQTLKRLISSAHTCDSDIYFYDNLSEKISTISKPIELELRLIDIYKKCYIPENIVDAKYENDNLTLSIIKLRNNFQLERLWFHDKLNLIELDCMIMNKLRTIIHTDMSIPKPLKEIQIKKDSIANEIFTVYNSLSDEQKKEIQLYHEYIYAYISHTFSFNENTIEKRKKSIISMLYS